MSWNQGGGGGGGGGPWGTGGPGGPWGSGGRGFQPPNFEDSLRKLQNFLKRWLPGGGAGLGGGRGWLLGFIVIVFLWLLSGFYRVEPDQEGIVLRWGAFDRKATPGPQLSSAVADRRGADADRDAHQPHRDRLSHQPGGQLAAPRCRKNR